VLHTVLCELTAWPPPNNLGRPHRNLGCSSTPCIGCLCSVLSARVECCSAAAWRSPCQRLLCSISGHMLNTPLVISWYSAGVCCGKGVLAREPGLCNTPDMDLLSCGGRDSTLGEAADQALLHSCTDGKAPADIAPAVTALAAAHITAARVPCSCRILGTITAGVSLDSAVSFGLSSVLLIQQ
jgi:hypothetical protein